jgi:beta-lactamase class D
MSGLKAIYNLKSLIFNLMNKKIKVQLSITNYILLFSILIVAVSSCSVNKAKIDNSLKKYFDENKVDGCFTMFDNATGKVTVYNMALDTMRFTPASTFKIVNSLIGLEIGKVTDEKMVIKWDGIKRWNEDWNKDLTMEEAFKVSAVPYYQELARRIGKDTMQNWLDSLHYGNQTIGSRVDSFWLDNSLKISADEQLGLVKRLYFDQLPFQKRTQQIVRDVMTQEDNTMYKLSYKTGWGFDEKNNNIGWIVGWVEENKHPYFFVTLVKSADKNIDMRAVRLNITKGILTQFGFFKGTM